MATEKKEMPYIEAVGRRKTSVARVRITQSEKGSIMVNDLDVKKYFPTRELQQSIQEAFIAAPTEQHFAMTVHVRGGGISSQAQAVRHGLARALTVFDGELRKPLKSAGLLTRDPRMKERRKFGLKKARRAPQWSKR
jgi:small subunit ribosomal protein S9